jgi:flagellar hook-associated protein 2
VIREEGNDVMTNSINLAALGFGGIDTSSLVSGLVAVESQPMTALQTQETNEQSAATSISSFSSTLSALSQAALTLSDPSTFESMSVTSSDSSIVGTASDSPDAGQWTVSVSSMAQAQRTLSNGAASSTTALGLSGTLEITSGSGSPTPIAISSTDSLTDIANAISSAGLPVQASILYDGSQYHLLVSGNNTGSANAISFDESGLTGGSGFSLGLSTASNTLQQATNANLDVGGVAITSATNQVTDAIPGVTLAVTQPTTTPATVSITPDATSAENEVQAFVTAYNNMVTSGHTTAGYGTTAASNSLLQGDVGVESSLEQMSQIVAEQIPGATGSYTSLADVGVTLNSDGTLAFSTSTFATALQNDPTSVQSLFCQNSSNGTTGIMSQIASTIISLTDPATGVIQAELNGFSSREQTMTTEISSMQTQVSAYQTQLQNEFTQMNTMLEQYKQMATALTDEADSADGTSSSSSSSSVI